MRLSTAGLRAKTFARRQRDRFSTRPKYSDRLNRARELANLSLPPPRRNKSALEEKLYGWQYLRDRAIEVNKTRSGGEDDIPRL